MRPEAVLIAGPTASGKSALALRLAEAHAGVVVNADSCQVYAELAIITARPSADDVVAAPHRLYGYRSAGSAASVADWLADVAAVLAEARADGRLPIIVGGTGLYFKALTEGLAAIPDIPDDIRRHWRERAAIEGAMALHAELGRRDAQMAARLRPNDPQRLARALEVIDATGRSLADWQDDPPSPPLLPAASALLLAIEPDRAWLHERINRRFERMLAAGALDEARDLAALDLDPALPAMRAIGVRPLIAAVAGEIEPAEAVRRGQAESRQYAKRQLTWMRHQMADWMRLPAGDVDSAAVSIHPILSK
ncbi:MAG: tRNA (adenosine(37)-N6)-dimethylallyltransferase MiaA [Ancalomicrobiaceae bacterium]|nr:tRNA (adenosine(37)-N6)-dimethylallyltransferase MiaA [Ancalomicrobiaceae bacterium]